MAQIHSSSGAGHTGSGVGALLHGVALKSASIGAAIGGGFLLLMALVTVASIVGRLAFNSPIAGTYEIVQFCSVVAVFSFFPYAHITRSNVTADLFTDWLPAPRLALLVLVWDLVFLGVSGLLLWRIGVGLIEKLHETETTMILGIPAWLFYVPATLWVALLVFTCVATSLDTILGGRK